MSTLVRAWLVLLVALVLGACSGSSHSARAPIHGHAGWVEQALGEPVEMSLVVRLERARSDPFIGPKLEAYLSKFDDPTLAALLRARSFELYSELPVREHCV